MANMAHDLTQTIVLALLRRADTPLSPREMQKHSGADISLRTLRRWLSGWMEEGLVERTGKGPATRYRYIDAQSSPALPGFLRGLEENLRKTLLAQIRDLWTHDSTALEGNTLSLGDTHLVLEEGLTISGKPLKDHHEVVGHARAIDLVYQSLEEPLTADLVFALHTAVQTEAVTDIFRPQGAWKREPNFTYAIGPDGDQVIIEYARPVDVPALMLEFLDAINRIDAAELAIDDAHEVYARFHMAFVHVHPFSDGNGRLARLLANSPLLRAGFPPLTIPNERRSEYIRILAHYQTRVGRLTREAGLWPRPALLQEFSDFCASCYQPTRRLVASAIELQRQIDETRS
jgi:Fic family protein